MEFIYSALFIMCLRIMDVTVGVMRMLMVVQGRKYVAGALGFVEVTIWAFAIRHIMLNLDNILNIFGYSTGSRPWGPARSCSVSGYTPVR